MSEFNPAAFEKIKEKNKRKQKRKKKNYIVNRLGDKTPQQVADEMNVTTATIRQWIYGRGVPDNRILEWCAVTGERLDIAAPHLYPPYKTPMLMKYFKAIYKEAA